MSNKNLPGLITFNKSVSNSSEIVNPGQGFTCTPTSVIQNRIADELDSQGLENQNKHAPGSDHTYISSAMQTAAEDGNVAVVISTKSPNHESTLDAPLVRFLTSLTSEPCSADENPDILITRCKGGHGTMPMDRNLLIDLNKLVDVLLPYWSVLSVQQEKNITLQSPQDVPTELPLELSAELSALCGETDLCGQRAIIAECLQRHTRVLFEAAQKHVYEALTIEESLRSMPGWAQRLEGARKVFPRIIQQELLGTSAFPFAPRSDSMAMTPSSMKTAVQRNFAAMMQCGVDSNNIRENVVTTPAPGATVVMQQGCLMDFGNACEETHDDLESVQLEPPLRGPASLSRFARDAWRLRSDLPRLAARYALSERDALRMIDKVTGVAMSKLWTHSVAGDRASLVPPALRLRTHEWRLLGAARAAARPPRALRIVTRMQVEALCELARLATTLRVEARCERWPELCGRTCSGVVLQWRWHALRTAAQRVACPRGVPPGMPPARRPHPLVYLIAEWSGCAGLCPPPWAQVCAAGLLLRFQISDLCVDDDESSDDEAEVVEIRSEKDETMQNIQRRSLLDKEQKCPPQQPNPSEEFQPATDENVPTHLMIENEWNEPEPRNSTDDSKIPFDNKHITDEEIKREYVTNIARRDSVDSDFTLRFDEDDAIAASEAETNPAEHGSLDTDCIRVLERLDPNNVRAMIVFESDDDDDMEFENTNTEPVDTKFEIPENLATPHEIVEKAAKVFRNSSEMQSTGEVDEGNSTETREMRNSHGIEKIKQEMPTGSSNEDNTTLTSADTDCTNSTNEPMINAFDDKKHDVQLDGYNTKLYLSKELKSNPDFNDKLKAAFITARVESLLRICTPVTVDLMRLNRCPRKDRRRYTVCKVRPPNFLQRILINDVNSCELNKTVAREKSKKGTSESPADDMLVPLDPAKYPSYSRHHSEIYNNTSTDRSENNGDTVRVFKRYEDVISDTAQDFLNGELSNASCSEINNDRQPNSHQDRKRVDLPDLDSVRRSYQNLQTALVAPMSLQETATPPADENQQDPQSLPHSEGQNSQSQGQIMNAVESANVGHQDPLREQPSQTPDQIMVPSLEPRPKLSLFNLYHRQKKLMKKKSTPVATTNEKTKEKKSDARKKRPPKHVRAALLRKQKAAELQSQRRPEPSAEDGYNEWIRQKNINNQYFNFGPQVAPRGTHANLNDHDNEKVLNKSSTKSVHGDNKESLRTDKCNNPPKDSLSQTSHSPNTQTSADLNNASSGIMTDNCNTNCPSANIKMFVDPLIGANTSSFSRIVYNDESMVKLRVKAGDNTPASYFTRVNCNAKSPSITQKPNNPVVSSDSRSSSIIVRTDAVKTSEIANLQANVAPKIASPVITIDCTEDSSSVYKMSTGPLISSSPRTYASIKHSSTVVSSNIDNQYNKETDASIISSPPSIVTNCNVNPLAVNKASILNTKTNRNVNPFAVLKAIKDQMKEQDDESLFVSNTHTNAETKNVSSTKHKRRNRNVNPFAVIKALYNTSEDSNPSPSASTLHTEIEEKSDEANVRNAFEFIDTLNDSSKGSNMKSCAAIAQTDKTEIYKVEISSLNSDYKEPTTYYLKPLSRASDERARICVRQSETSLSIENCKVLKVDEISNLTLRTDKPNLKETTQPESQKIAPWQRSKLVVLDAKEINEKLQRQADMAMAESEAAAFAASVSGADTSLRRRRSRSPQSPPLLWNDVLNSGNTAATMESNTKRPRLAATEKQSSLLEPHKTTTNNTKSRNKKKDGNVIQKNPNYYLVRKANNDVGVFEMQSAFDDALEIISRDRASLENPPSPAQQWEQQHTVCNNNQTTTCINTQTIQDTAPPQNTAPPPIITPPQNTAWQQNTAATQNMVLNNNMLSNLNINQPAQAAGFNQPQKVIYRFVSNPFVENSPNAILTPLNMMRLNNASNTVQMPVPAAAFNQPMLFLSGSNPPILVRPSVPSNANITQNNTNFSVHM